jgi:ArsR family transcriptional regulator, arsenate/arsenite/antimonite-responsive transcriptional repressor
MSVSLSKLRAAQAANAHLFHALSDETRLAVLDMLRGGEQCVCDLQSALDAAQSRLSFHLKVLKDAGLVTDRKEGRWSYYQLNPDRLAEASAVLGRLASPTVRGGALRLHQLERAMAGPGGTKGRAASTAARRPRIGASACCD